MSRSVFSILVLASTLILPCPSTAQIESSWENLRGLTGISIIVLGVTEEAERDGVDTARVRTVVELVLRSAGIQVFTEEERLQEREAPPRFRIARLGFQAGFLYAEASGATVVFCVEVGLLEELLTVGQQAVVGLIWTSGAYGTVGRDNLRKTITDAFKEDAEKFANDYLRANPRNR